MWRRRNGGIQNARRLPNRCPTKPQHRRPMVGGRRIHGVPRPALARAAQPWRWDGGRWAWVRVKAAPCGNNRGGKGARRSRRWRRRVAGRRVAPDVPARFYSIERDSACSHGVCVKVVLGESSHRWSLPEEPKVCGSMWCVRVNIRTQCHE